MCDLLSTILTRQCLTWQRVTEDIDKAKVKGIGFDATCSLVVLDHSFQPVAVNQDGKQCILDFPSPAILSYIKKLDTAHVLYYFKAQYITLLFFLRCS